MNSEVTDLNIELLTSILSRRLTAYLANVNDTSLITTHGDRVRLHAALKIVDALLPLESEQVIKAWFMGMQPNFDDRTPAEMIHAGDLATAHDAACEFIAGA